MALSSTTHRWTRAVRTALGAGAVSALAIVALAIPAEAHTPKVLAKCKDGKTTLYVELKSYNGSQANSVVVTADGQNVADVANFNTDYVESWDFDATVPHHFKVVVVAWDDPSGQKKWSFTKELDVEACKTPPPPSTTTTTTTTTSEETTAPTTTEETTTPAPTTTAEVAPAPVPGDDDLANTGASIAIPAVLGALLLLGGGALVLLARKRRAEQA